MCVTGAWAEDIVYALDNENRSGDAEPYTYTYTFSEAKYQNKTVKVEVPSATSAGTISFKSNGNSTDRILYIYKENGTVKDESRSFMMSPKNWVTAINYWPSDILTDGGKYYLVFSTTSDWKSVGVKFTTTTLTSAYTVTYVAGANGTCATTSDTESKIGYGVTLPAVTPNAGYVFNGWFTEASDGTKVGDAGDLYHPTASGSIYAQYVAAVAPTITTQPENVNVPGNNTASFSVEATGSPAPTYQWFTCDADGDGESEIGGATNASYTLTAPVYDPDGTNVYYYKVKITNSAGNVTSNVVSLTVNKKVACSGYLSGVDDSPIQGGCTLKYYSTEGSLGTVPAGSQDGTYFCAKMNGDNNYYELAMTGGFKAGDILTVYLQGATKAYKVGKTPKTSVSTSGSAAVAGVSHTLAANEIEDNGTVRIYRNSSNTYFAGASVVGATDLTITAGSQYATFVTTRAIDMAKANAADIKAYIVTGKDETTVTTEEVTEVPANTPILLKAASEGVAAVTVSVDDIVSASLASVNKLKYSDTPIDGDGSTIYGFFKVGGQYGFAPVASGSTLAARKAYLEISGGALQSHFLALDMDGETTAINAVSTAQAKKEGVKKVVKDGRLVIEKDGVQYSVAGTQLK